MSKSFRDIALPLITRGLYVFPLSSDGRKVPLIKDWPNMASNSMQHILYWDAAYDRDINVGVVARGVCILDDDRGDLAGIILKETGFKLPTTYAVKTSVKKSTGLRGMHYYFRETPESLICGFRKKAGVYDFQCEHHQVVGAGSRHHSGLIYEEVDPSREILPCPTPLVSWIFRTADAPKRPEHSGSRDRFVVHEDFDFDDMCQHYEPIFHIVGSENDYHWPDPCPWTDHRHENSPKTGFYWDGSNLGWSDFVTTCEGNGKKIGDAIHYLNARMVELGLEPYPCCECGGSGHAGFSTVC
jgi:hypothetical protein